MVCNSYDNNRESSLIRGLIVVGHFSFFAQRPAEWRSGDGETARGTVDARQIISPPMPFTVCGVVHRRASAIFLA